LTASIRIIKIVKDKNPISNDEEEMYTVEIEVETEDAMKLAMELEKSPYGKQIVELLERAEFIPTKEAIEEKVKYDQEEHDKEVVDAAISDYRDGMLEKITEFLQKKGKIKTAEAIELLFEEPESKDDMDAENDDDVVNPT
jgi:glutamyl-tRNA reductase